MEAFKQLNGIVAPVDRVNVDTDAIIPKQFLKRIERTGFGQFLFYEWRFDEAGNDNPAFEMNKPRYEGASVLISRANFGCGSSREHAPWAIMDYGFRVVIAPSYADIFYNNCFKNGILPIKLSEAQVDDLFNRTAEHEGYKLNVDLENKTLSDDYGLIISFELDEHRRQFLLQGLDDIGLTLKHADEIAAYEERHAAKLFAR
ncbi:MULTISPECIES: 3-isopropylmalate dehydratase small subunit [unclassified Paenibacillus]|uniref:3-isopropylmalate dehydratase small subunit n=1 Tax=unclassified Paenibacillus TaxID=185978 RepID=UPI002405F807|nr:MULTISPECIES: 3-isopropylmalate dehydratase small subunit [unclassified Paenibacillus]MDF9840262.1 3-isopropylmalate/(R)-2-methylmalate dehydratase small subunit [Paenibacillus sp. PastF-2]MDF9846844.1 3-isopropylmalate/(R)-2-methylmalate dehydratase small subunit [Paenibacillus sp. PastM-2]MDF9853416.1 3-isopropylmalate/(R)-2-methylmalate dehydratase small subunit [Paenibacillus sp. PastF-1]MDH6479097.1 3-isopropylmalate/(R)-2-methylmalate dehydratase small subunit [Paenibacillus sp. PastH-